MAIALAVRRHGRSLATLSAVGAARSPDTLAVVDDFGSITYRQLFERVCRIAGAMHYVYGVRRAARSPCSLATTATSRKLCWAPRERAPTCC
ncbi:AMP-dependent synthetase and ligase domain protein [Mycobacterium xenopi 4042]|uniref:AMP-dependent synthetase and ligase domain protein n=1 Tax=Mycobacterium xenopi 4042 TaxID=1299334 RepID=X8DKQ2_MYCXE|nr:AMP-dependent synthetase and ligase domain protein [Mycobacterium xenopi 4042]